MFKKIFNAVFIIIYICLIVITVIYTAQVFNQINSIKEDKAIMDETLQEIEKIEDQELPSFELINSLLLPSVYNINYKSKIVSNVDELNEIIKDIVEGVDEIGDSDMEKFDSVEEFYRTSIIEKCFANPEILKYDEEYFENKSLVFCVRENPNEKRIHYYIKDNNTITFIKELQIVNKSTPIHKGFVIDVCEVDKDITIIDNPDEPKKTNYSYKSDAGYRIQN